MIVYRICQSSYKDDLSGYGAYLYGGRWNLKGFAALYTAEHISLAVLELVVNFNRSSSPLMQPYHLLSIEIPDKSVEFIEPESLKRNWIDAEADTQQLGTNFLQQQKHLALKVPSAVVPEEFNFMINPAHELFSKVKIIKSVKYGFDGRLLR